MTLAAGLAALELFPQASARPWVIAAAVLSAAGCVTFFRVEKNAPSPVLPLDLLRVRNFSAPIVAQAFGTFVYFSGFVLTPLLLELQFGLSAASASLILVLRTGAFCVGAQVPSRIRGLTPRGAAMIGAAVMAAGPARFCRERLVVITSLGRGREHPGRRRERDDLAFPHDVCR